MATDDTEKTHSQVVRIVSDVGLLLVFLLLSLLAGRAGLASLFSRYAALSNQLPAADLAVSLSRNDPDAHLIRGALFEAAGDLSRAVADYRDAALLRPNDYVLWLSLARALELNGDVPGGLVASSQAVQLAPFYAQPHWQFGNILIRAGQRDKGFRELSQAAASNPTLMPGIIDLAWHISNGNLQFVERSINPHSPESYQALGEYFRKRGEATEAIAMFRAAGKAAQEARRAYLGQLISARQFKDAYALWVVDHPPNSHNAPGAIIDSGFEQESDLDEPGFGWRKDNHAPSMKLSLDPANPKEGHSSAKVEFNGDSDPGSPILSQLVLVEPSAHYQLRFAARTEDLVSGGLPRLAIFEASDRRILGQPLLFPRNADMWSDFSIDFSSVKSTTAIEITLDRESCSKSPCPIFGHLWLDNFSLQKGRGN